VIKELSNLNDETICEIKNVESICKKYDDLRGRSTLIHLLLRSRT